MLERAHVQAWLDAYADAWKTNDPRAIGDLFGEDASYYYTPYSPPIQGRTAIVSAWLDDRDMPGTYDGRYEPLVVEGDRAVAHGHSRYLEADGSTLRTEFANIFVLRFDEDGRCTEYREWYMERPEE